MIFHKFQIAKCEENKWISIRHFYLYSYSQCNQNICVTHSLKDFNVCALERLAHLHDTKCLWIFLRTNFELLNIYALGEIRML